LDLTGPAPQHDTIATLWARAKVDDVMNADLAAVQAGTGADAVKQQIIELGTTFQIMTQFTSFVAVGKNRVTNDGETRLVAVPIEFPDGQDFDSTLGALGTDSDVQALSAEFDRATTSELVRYDVSDIHVTTPAFRGPDGQGSQRPEASSVDTLTEL